MYSDRQLREIFHFHFLEHLLRMTDVNMFVLKGGVNLRFFFHSPRYSEDTDLDVLQGSVATVRKNGYKLLSDAAFLRGMRTFGITNIDINSPDRAKHTETTQRFRVQLVSSSGQRLPSKVEFWRRPAGKSTVAGAALVEQLDAELARQYNRLNFRCQHYGADAATAQKLLALAGRAVTQARDVFDVQILQRACYGRNLALGQVLAAQQRETALENLASLSYDDYAGQVLEFLDPESLAEHRGREAWSAMVDSVRALLQPP